MEQQRLFLIILLAAISLMLYMEWQKDYHSPIPQTATSPTNGSVPVEGTAPRGEGEMPVPTAGVTTTPAEKTSEQAVAPPTPKTGGKLITVESDVYRLVIDTQGGDIQQLDLMEYSVTVEQPDNPFRLLDDSAVRNFQVQSGFYVPGDAALRDLTPGRNTVYESAQDHYDVTSGARDVDLVWRNAQGMEFIIRYTFSPKSYLVKVAHIINNPTQQAWEGNVYLRLQRVPPPGGGNLAMMPTYVGPVYYSPDEKYQKIPFDDIDDAGGDGNGVRDAIDREFSGGWAAMIEHYFASAWIPPKDQTYRYFTARLDNNRYLIGLSSPQHTVAANSKVEVSSDLFVGPKVQNTMENIAPGLELTVDYGWLTFLAKPLFWILEWIHRYIGNWGWAIVLLTLGIKLVFYKLSEASYKSMANMRRVQPRMVQIKERYAGDKQRMNQAMMELYRKEKINPLGGCLPILIQIPVFIALYYMLLESVELRQADWILWINDLSVKDPYYVLPILMGISMLVQMKLNPAPVDPIQAKIMTFLPIVFTVLFLFFPSGLVLYWVVNNVLSIAQQWYITRVVIKDKKPAS